MRVIFSETTSLFCQYDVYFMHVTIVTEGGKPMLNYRDHTQCSTDLSIRVFVHMVDEV